MTALIEMPLSKSTALQLEHAQHPLWDAEYVRKTVRDMLDVTSVPQHIIVNPYSNKDYQIEVAGAFDGKSAIYAAFKFALDEYAVFFPGRHEANIDLSKPRTLKAVSFRTDQNGRWHCFRIQNGGLVEIKFREKAEPDPYEVYLKDTYQNTHDMVDLVMQGAYCDVDLSQAPGLYAYFLELLAMDPANAKATIEQHEDNRIAQNNAWQKAQGKEPASSFLVNGEEMPASTVENLGRVTATKDEEGFQFTVNAKNLAYLTELVEEGYVLSA